MIPVPGNLAIRPLSYQGSFLHQGRTFLLFAIPTGVYPIAHRTSYPMGVLSPMASAFRSALRMYRAHAQTCIRANAPNMLYMPRARSTRGRARERISGGSLKAWSSRIATVGRVCEQKHTRGKGVKDGSGRREVCGDGAERDWWVRASKHSPCPQFVLRRCSGASSWRNIFFNARRNKS